MTTSNYEYYGLMAQFWDLFRGDTSDWEDRFFYLDVVKKYGTPVLDVGCGTGRILLDFMSQDIDIDGVDNSPEMLELCKQKAQTLNLNPNLHQQEMDKLSLPKKYQTILVPSSSFQLLLDETLATITMQKFYEHLLPNGILSMPFMTLWKTGDPLETESIDEAIREDGATVKRWSYTLFDPSTDLEHTIDKYEVIKDGEVTQTEEHHQSPATRSYTQTQAIALYQNAGFKNIQVFEGFSFEPVKSDSMLFCITGMKI